MVGHTSLEEKVLETATSFTDSGVLPQSRALRAIEACSAARRVAAPVGSSGRVRSGKIASTIAVLGRTDMSRTPWCDGWRLAPPALPPPAVLPQTQRRRRALQWRSAIRVLRLIRPVN